jgi:hypothetical protein
VIVGAVGVAHSRNETARRNAGPFYAAVRSRRIAISGAA